MMRSSMRCRLLTFLLADFGVPVSPQDDIINKAYLSDLISDQNLLFSPLSPTPPALSGAGASMALAILTMMSVLARFLDCKWGKNDVQTPIVSKLDQMGTRKGVLSGPVQQPHEHTIFKQGKKSLMLNLYSQGVVGMLLIKAGDVEQNPGPPKRQVTPPPELKDLAKLGIVNWRNVGLNLGLNDSLLWRIKADNAQKPDHTQNCVTDMFSWWLHSCTNPTYSQLVEALVSAGEKTAAMELCEIHGIALPTYKASLVFPSSTIKEYATHMMKVYSSCNWPLFPKRDWPPKLSKVFINLKLVKHQRLSKTRDEKLLASTMQYGAVEEIHNSVGYLQLDELFLTDEQVEKQRKMRRDPEFEPFCITSMNLMVHEKLNPPEKVASNHLSNEPLSDEWAQVSTHKQQEIPLRIQQNTPGIKILADGVPGVGKTTVSRKLCKDWAEGVVYLSNYNLVVFIPLRDETVGRATELWQLLPHGSKSLKQAVADELENNEGENVLLIFDGWDELPVEYQKVSLVRKIIEGKTLIECSVLVTSRPHASAELLRKEIPDRHVEISGLTKEQIKECIMEHFMGYKNIGKELISQVEMQKQLMSLCYIPLNLSIVLYVYKIMETLPRTLTEIYDIYIKNVLIRAADLVYLKDLDELPPEALQTYRAITKVAFNGFMDNTLEFSSQQLEVLECSHSESVRALGLMTAYKSYTPASGVVTKYQFTHLTMQEFLAAEELAQKPIEKQREFLWKYLSDGRFTVLLQFFAGRTKLKYLDDFFKIPCPTLDYVRFRMILRLAHETQTVQFFKSFAHTSAKNVLQVNCQRWRSYDMQVLVAFLSSLDWNRQKLNLSFLITRDYGEQSFKDFLHFVNTAMNDQSARIQETSRSSFTLTVVERTRANSVFCDPGITNTLAGLQFLSKVVVKRKSLNTVPGNSYNLILLAISSLPYLSSLVLESDYDISETDIAITSHTLYQLLSSRKTPFSLKMVCMKLDGISSITHYLLDSQCLLKELELIIGVLLILVISAVC